MGHGGDVDGWVDSRVDHQSLVDARRTVELGSNDWI